MYVKHISARKQALLVAVVSMLSAIGCGPDHAESPWATPRPLGRDIAAFRPGDEPAGAGAEPVKVEEPTGVLSLRQALGLALAGNPELTAVSWKIRSAEAEGLQAGLAPNPDVRAQWGDLGGTGSFRGTRNSEQRIRLGQVIELAGKARKRRRVAQFGASMCGWDYETIRLDVFAKTTKAFTAALAAERRLGTAEEMHQSANDTLSAIAKRVKGGMAAGLEAAQARVELGNSRIEVAQARQAMFAARGLLAACWGSRHPKFTRVAGDLNGVVEVPALEQLLPRISGNPDVARWETQINLQKAVLELERANSIPDPRALFTARRLEESGDVGYTVAVEVDLPVYNRNQGAIRRARFDRIWAAHGRQAAIATAETALHEAYEVLSASYQEAAILKNDILPAAQDRADIASRGLQLGAVTYLDVMKANRALNEVKVRLIDALGNFHTAVVDVERLIAQPIVASGAADRSGKRPQPPSPDGQPGMP